MGEGWGRAPWLSYPGSHTQTYGSSSLQQYQPPAWQAMLTLVPTLPFHSEMASEGP